MIARVLFTVLQFFLSNFSLVAVLFPLKRELFTLNVHGCNAHLMCLMLSDIFGQANPIKLDVFRCLPGDAERQRIAF